MGKVANRAGGHPKLKKFPSLSWEKVKKRGGGVIALKSFQKFQRSTKLKKSKHGERTKRERDIPVLI